MHMYEYRHRVCLDETNVVGNVYFAHYLRWQGHCREMFLRDYVPSILDEFSRGLALVTTRASCSYYQELAAFDEVSVQMTLRSMSPTRVVMVFRYVRVTPNGREELVAEGEQEVACVRRQGQGAEPVDLPQALRAAVEDYSNPSRQQRGWGDLGSATRRNSGDTGTVENLSSR
jgi:enediyne core biosynthesis thioesterase